MKKRAAKKAKTQKVTGVAAKILEEKGAKWVKNNCGSAKPTNPAQVADLVYYHFLESKEGERAWAQGEQSEEKVDYIFDEIYTTYVADGELMTDEEWSKISDSLYSMVYEGVF